MSPLSQFPSLDDISYVAAVGACAIAGFVLWWAYGRYESRWKRALSSAVTYLIAFIVYFALGLIFIIIRPDVAHETGKAIGHGFKLLTTMFIVVNAVVVAIHGRTKKHPSEG